MRILKNSILSFIVGFVVVITATTGAVALTLDVRGGQLYGALGVDVGGTLYDVEFVEGTCASLFGGCDDASDFAFNTQTDAELASWALLDQVFLDIPNSYQFDSDQNATYGIDNHLDSITFGNIFTPYQYNQNLDQVEMSYAGNNKIESSDRVGTNPFQTRDLDSLGNGFIVYAKWNTPQVSAVPLPTALPLYGAGLALMGFIGWRRRSRRRSEI